MFSIFRASTVAARSSVRAVAQVLAPRAAFASSAARTAPAEIDASKVQVELTSSPGEILPYETLQFGKTFTDHQLEVKWNAKDGWGAPHILPFQNIPMHPASACLHYAIEGFEGMKAYLDADERIRLFRPYMNMARLNRTAKRLALPGFNGEQYLECIKELLRVDKRFIPHHKGYSLYVRPTIISTQPTLGVGPSADVLLFTICSPVGPYYPEGFKPVSLMAQTKYVRAWPGGAGDAKVGGNYSPTILPQVEAAKKGYSQILWLFGENDELTEVGTMNAFVVMKTRDGETELITAPLDGTILPGVTRDSILDLVKGWGEMKVSERTVTMPEIVEALSEGRLVEMFGSGTAAIVSPINKIFYNGVDYDIPLNPADKNAAAGVLTQRLMDTILGIQYGEIEHKDWSVVVD